METLDLLSPDAEITLETCDREPVHMPSAIQPHGALLVVDPDTFVVLQASQNIEDWLDVSHEDVLGRRLDGFLLAGALDDLKTVRDGAAPEDVAPISASLSQTRRTVDLLPYLTEAGLVIEIEDTGHEAIIDGLRTARPVRKALRALDEAPTFEALLDTLAHEVRESSGFDRVMVYQFSDEGHGKIVAESRVEDLESFYGLHYPAADIPVQARILFVRNRIRLITDIDYTPVPVVPARSPRTGAALDMSASALRSVSICHVEYLQNMGVSASMAISIVRDGRLWGVVACHHMSPRLVPMRIRLACDLIGQVAAMQIGLKQDQTEVAYEAKRQSMLSRLVESMLHEAPPGEVLTTGSTTLLDLVDAAGAAVIHEGEVSVVGETPAASIVQALFDAFVDEAPEQPIVAFDDRRAFPKAAPALGEVAGVLAVLLDTDAPTGVIWFRPEVAQTVTWGGEPGKIERTEENGTITLHPRNSFEAWTELVEGRSEPWTRGDLRAAADLQRALVRVVLSRAEELARVNAELTQSNAELDAFTYVASHDLKEPLRGIHNFAQFVIEDHAAELGEEGRAKLETIARLSERLDGFIDSLLEYSRAGRLHLSVEAVPLADVVSEARDLLSGRLAERNGTVEVVGELPTVHADRVRLGEVLTNLISNGIKYNDSDTPHVKVGVADRTELAGHAEAGAADRAFYVRDNGIGIPERHHESVFRIFKRLHGRDAYGGGTGAGLTIVQKLVERHGGAIWIRPNDGGGTTFWFTLPTRR